MAKEYDERAEPNLTGTLEVLRSELERERGVNREMLSAMQVYQRRVEAQIFETSDTMRNFARGAIWYALATFALGAVIGAAICFQRM